LNEVKKKESKNKNYPDLDTDAIIACRVVEARELLPMDMTGFSDPYVSIKFGSQIWKSSYIKQNLNPVWNELYNFDVETG
jgi:Ras GTPase-activating protein 4